MRDHPSLGRVMLAPLGVCTVVLSLSGTPVFAADDAFEQGLTAYVSGDYAEARRIWQPLADAGDVVAAFNMGILYAQGLGVTQDPAAAVRWYRRAADAGYAPAQFNLGAAYREGSGVEADMDQAIAWWRKAAMQKHPQAVFNLATLYFHGDGVELDRAKARELYQQAADLGDPRAQNIVSKLAETAETPVAPVPEPPPDTAPPESPGAPAEPVAEQPSAPPPPEAEPSAEVAAAPPGPQAATIRSEAWVREQDGEHLTIQLFAFGDEQSAVQFIQAHGLESDAAYFKGTSGDRTWYKTIYGVYPDMDAARAARNKLPDKLKANAPWIRKFSVIQREMRAAPQSRRGSPRSTTALAVRRVPAHNVRALHRGQSAFNGQDYGKAFQLWRPLAEQGDAEAQYSLGFLYESGWGTTQSYADAFRWYRRAAQQGHSKAQYNLGLLYFRGLGVDEDRGLGYYWIQSAADREHVRAMEFLRDKN